MSNGTVSSNANGSTLTKKDLTRCGLRWMLSGIWSFNYGTQLAGSVVLAEKQALRKIYADDDEGYRKSLENAFRYFNATPQMAGFILGAGLAMEDAEHAKALEAVQDLKLSLMGPLSGIGDSVIMVLIPTITGSLAAYMAQSGSPVGLIIQLIVNILTLPLLKVVTWNIGYKFGSALITTLADKIAAFTESASILGLTVVGALIPTVVSIKTGLAFTMGDVTLGLQEGVLDSILVGMLPVLATFIVYKLLKKKVNMMVIILGIIVISCLGAATGILTI